MAELQNITQELYVNGLRRTVLDADVTLGFRGYISAGNFTLLAEEGVIFSGDEIVYRFGQGGDLVKVFAGQDEIGSLALWPSGQSCQAAGPLAAAQRPIGLDALEDPTDIDGNPIPVLQWPHDDADATEYTDTMIVTEVLDFYGIAHADIQGRGVVLASLDLGFIKILPKENGLDLIQTIDRAMGYVTFDDVDGKVKRIIYNGLPSSSTGMSFVEGFDLVEGSRERSIRDIINRATVKGDPDAGGGLFVPEATIQANSPVNPNTGKPYIPTPPGYQSEEFSTVVLKTEADCEDTAQRIVAEKNRIKEAVALTVPGNPRITPGMTCYTISPTLGLGTDILWLIQEVQHKISGASAVTTLQLTGGYGSDGGLNTNQAPIMSLTYTVEKEILADGSSLYTIIADASDSKDPDGAYLIPAQEETDTTPATAEISFNGIVLYAWTSTLAGSPNILNGGKRAIWTETTNPGGNTITVTGYDIHGKTGTATVPIINSDANPFLVRDLWTAEGSRLGFTNDGGRTWQYFAVNAVGCCRMAAALFNLAWDAGGQLSRCVAAGLVATPIAAVTNATAASIRWKFPETGMAGDRCWAGGAAGEIYRSTDRGLTWAQISTLPNGQAVTVIEESPFAENDLTAAAGNTLYHSFDGLTWAVLYAHPAVSLVAASFASGFDKGFVVYHGATVAQDATISRIHERAGLVAGDWNRSTATLSPPAATYLFVYTYVNGAGETPASPSASQALAADHVASLTFPAWPDNVQYGKIYVKKGTDPYRFYSTNFGANVVSFDHYPASGNPPPASNTTDPVITPPATALTTASVAAAAASSIDAPARANGVTMAVYKEEVYVVGLTPGGTPMAWWAASDADFTLTRGAFDSSYGTPNDVIRDGQIEDIVYGAADSAFFKTTDAFRTSIHKIKVPQTKGWKLGYGTIHPIVVIGEMIWSAWDNASLASACIMALTADGFERRCDPHPCAGLGGLSAFPAYPLRANGSVLFTWAREGNGGDSFPYHAPLGVATNAYRSADGGATWDALPMIKVNHIVPAGDGATVYATSADADIAPGVVMRVWRSTDNGANWTDMAEWVATDAQWSPISHLTVDPSDPLKITIHGRFVPAHGIPNFNVRQNVLASNDGGATWFDTGIVASDEAGNQYGGRYASTRLGSLLRQDARPAPEPIRRSVIGGALDVAVTGAIASAFYARDATRDYYYLDTGIYASTDDGQSWTQIYSGTNCIFQSGVHTGDANVIAFLPGDAGNDWYMAPGSFGKLGRRLAAALESDNWENLTGALDLAFPDGRTWPFIEGIARISTGG